MRALPAWAWAYAGSRARARAKHSRPFSSAGPAYAQAHAGSALTQAVVFAVQDGITQSVVEKLKVKLLGQEDVPVIERPTDNLEAYNLVLQGRYRFLKLTSPS